MTLSNNINYNIIYAYSLSGNLYSYSNITNTNINNINSNLLTLSNNLYYNYYNKIYIDASLPNNLYVFSLSGNLFNTNSNINNNYYNKSYVDSLYKTSSTTTNLITTNYFISQFP